MAISHSTDAHIGNQLRTIRTRLGLTQESIGSIINVSFQQVQKYERGTNCIGADNLYLLAQGLEIPVEFFFEGLQNPPIEENNLLLSNMTYTDEERKLLHYFHKIPNKNFKAALIALIETIAKDDVFIKAA